MNRSGSDPATCFAPTRDRWALVLHRYRQDEPGAPAAILCSVYACNRHFIDFDDRYSLARFLWRRGFDTWVVELRGRGKIHPLPGCRAPDQWTFDDLAHIDVPTALAYVRRALGHGRIAWIGHSMGGMVVYAHLGMAGRGVVPAAAVTLGSPVVFPQVASELAHRIGCFPARPSLSGARSAAACTRRPLASGPPHQSRGGRDEPRQRRPHAGRQGIATGDRQRLARQAEPARGVGLHGHLFFG